MDTTTHQQVIDLHKHFSAALDAISERNERRVYSRYGRPEIALLGLDDLRRLEETIAVLDDPALLPWLTVALTAIADGESSGPAAIEDRLLW